MREIIRIWEKYIMTRKKHTKTKKKYNSEAQMKKYADGAKFKIIRKMKTVDAVIAPYLWNFLRNLFNHNLFKISFVELSNLPIRTTVINASPTKGKSAKGKDTYFNVNVSTSIP